MQDEDQNIPDKIIPETPNFQTELADKIAKLAPEVVTDGKLDVNKLRELVNGDTETAPEKFGLFWPGKQRAQAVAQLPTTATLKPAREDSVDWDNTKNIFIEGDNLEVLKVLQDSYRRKIKMIYIDPPYNTGKEFIYPDNFQEGLQTYLEYTGQKNEAGENTESKKEIGGRKHSNWLSMMYPRLQLAKSLLRQDGVIFISIDDNEMASLKKLCDEIFGEENFAGKIIWKNSSKNDQDYISTQHEYFIVYVRDKSVNSGYWRERKEGLVDIYKIFDELRKKNGTNWELIHKEALKWFNTFAESNPIYASKHYSWMDGRGVYFPADISGPNYGQYRYDVIHPITKRVCKEPASGWRYPQATMLQRINDGLVHFGKNENVIPNNKTYLKDTETQSLTSIKYKDGRVASKGLQKLMGANVFTNPKDKDMLASFIKACDLKEDDVVLDFFSGSATFAHSVMQLNAEINTQIKHIQVQLPELTYKIDEHGKEIPTKDGKDAYEAGYRNVADIAKERIRRAGKKLKEDYSDKISNRSIPLDTGFRVYKLAQSNFIEWGEVEATKDPTQAVLDFANNKKSDASPEDLLAEVMLRSRITLDAKVEKKDLSSGGRVYVVDDGKLVAYVDDDGLSVEQATEIADMSPAKFVALDSAFNGNDALKINIANLCKDKHVGEFKTI